MYSLDVPEIFHTLYIRLCSLMFRVVKNSSTFPLQRERVTFVHISLLVVGMNSTR